MISVRKPQARSQSRATSFNKHNVGDYVVKLGDVLQRYKFPPERIYTRLDLVQLNKYVKRPFYPPRSPNDAVACVSMYIDEALGDLPNTVKVVNDILIFDEDFQSHVEREFVNYCGAAENVKLASAARKSLRLH